MKAKDKETLRGMDIAKLDAEANKIREELARQQLEMRMKNAKDSNAVSKNKKRLAVVQTFLTEKRMSSKA
jgi:ribosomal protein L29